MATAEEKDKKGPEKKAKRESYVTFNNSMRELLLTIFIDVVKNKELMTEADRQLNVQGFVCTPLEHLLIH